MYSCTILVHVYTYLNLCEDEKGRVSTIDLNCILFSRSTWVPAGDLGLALGQQEKLTFQ